MRCGRKNNRKKSFLSCCIYTTVFLIALLRCYSPVQAQTDTLKAGVTLNAPKDTLVSDSSKKTLNWMDTSGIVISPSALTDEVKYTAKDSLLFNMESKKINMWGKPNVKWQDLQLDAGTIEYDLNSQEVVAEPVTDSTGTFLNRPDFKQGSENFVSDRIQYNFKSQRALVRNVRSQYDQGFVLSEQIKRNADQSIYGWKNVYTTCNLDTPHFGISARKIKIIPEKLIATGPAFINIEGIPTPLVLPLGMFPIKKGQRSGFKLPTYEISEQYGVGLRDLGYYFAINDYVDLLATATFYSYGTWRAAAASQYIKKYRYSGSFGLEYGYTKLGDEYSPGYQGESRDFVIKLNHRIDPKAFPGTNFSADINIRSNNANKVLSYNVNQIVQNQIGSSINYSKTWAGKPFNLSITGRHTQNSSTKEVYVNLPSVTFNVAQVNPFQRKSDVITTPRWYEKIGFSYTFTGINDITFIADSSFKFSNIALSDFRNGFQHSIPISASYKIFKYLTFTPAANYNEYWYTKQSQRYFDPAMNGLDTLSNSGFYTARDYNASATLSTQLFGMLQFKKGAVKAIRHVMYPSVSLSYKPDFSASPYHYYYKTYLDSSFKNVTMLSYYDGAPIGIPSSGKQGMINFSLNNNVQMKVRSSKDSATGFKKMNLIDRLGIATSYNMAVDSFNWSPVNLNFSTLLFQKLNISATANFDPYVFDKTQMRRVNILQVNQGGKLLNFTDASVSVGGSFNSKGKNQAAKKRILSQPDNQYLLSTLDQYADFDIPWNVNVNYSLSIRKAVTNVTKRDTMIIADNSIRVTGDFNVTARWKVAFSTGYDLVGKKIQITSFDIYRDLHCWDMRLGVIPFGTRRSYNFSINVKATVLQDLRLQRRRDFMDSF